MRRASQALPTTNSIADFSFPMNGNALILLRGGAAARLSQNIGEELTVRGTCSDGPFELFCPQYFVRSTSEWEKDPSWAIAVPVNEPVCIRYGRERPIRRVHAVINNFDFEYGNVESKKQTPNRCEVLRVEASGRWVDFSWRDGHDELTRMVDAEVLRPRHLPRFPLRLGGSNEKVSSHFADNIASLCGIVARQHTGVPVITFLDAETAQSSEL